LCDAKLTLLDGIAQVAEGAEAPIEASIGAHMLLSMSKVSIPTVIQNASAPGTVLAVRERKFAAASPFSK
jgi:hypothetical protein